MLLLLLTLNSFANPNSDRIIKYKDKTEIDFEELEIDGQLVKPQGSLIVDRPTATFNPLIKLRTNWSMEMTQSVEEVK